jgi:hypothetical protein
MYRIGEAKETKPREDRLRAEWEALVGESELPDFRPPSAFPLVPMYHRAPRSAGPLSDPILIFVSFVLFVVIPFSREIRVLPQATSAREIFSVLSLVNCLLPFSLCAMRFALCVS